MAVKRRPTTYQYEPLVTPSKWQGDELRFSVRLTQILDDLYQKFSSLRTGSGSASVAIADDANKLGGVEASKYALKTGTVANANKLGGKAPEYYLSPRNLLDNSDFRNPVNQRGGTSHTASENTASYWLDRWQFGRGTAALVDGGLSIVWNGNTSYGPNAYFRQTLGTALDIGKTYTLAVKVDGQIEAYSFINPSDDAADLYFKTNVYRVQIDSNKRTFVFYNYTTTPKVFEWAALYEGEYTAETLPPYAPKGYAAELLECKRYYQVIYATSSVYSSVLCGMITNSIKDVVVGLPVNTMRINPTASFDGLAIIRGPSGYIDDSNNGIEITPKSVIQNGSNISIVFNRTDGTAFSTNAVGNSPIELSFSKGSVLALSADL